MKNILIIVSSIGGKIASVEAIENKLNGIQVSESVNNCDDQHHSQREAALDNDKKLAEAISKLGATASETARFLEVICDTQNLLSTPKDILISKHLCPSEFGKKKLGYQKFHKTKRK